MRCWTAGTGRPVVFLHGNPTSSFLWRKVVPRLLGPDRRLVLVDLVGMGDSGKPPIEYRLTDHIDHVDALLDALDLPAVDLIAHDWGVAIAFACLHRHPERVRSLAFMEGHLRPLPGWDAFDEGGRDLFRRLRTPGVGEQMVLADNFFIETLLPAAIRGLTAEELTAYAAPYPTPESRRPLLQWARQIPVAGDPADVATLLPRAVAAAARASVPLLLVRARPGAVVGDDAVAWLTGHLPALTVAEVGPAGHFVPEDRPGPLAEVLDDWLRH